MTGWMTRYGNSPFQQLLRRTNEALFDRAHKNAEQAQALDSFAEHVRKTLRDSHRCCTSLSDGLLATDHLALLDAIAVSQEMLSGG